MKMGQSWGSGRQRIGRYNMQILITSKEFCKVKRLVEVSKKFIRAEGVRGGDDNLYLDMEDAISEAAEIWGDNKPY